MLIVFAMPGSLLMPSPVRFSRRMFHIFWTRLLKTWGGVSVSMICLLHPPSPGILGFWYLRTAWTNVSPVSVANGRMLAWEKALSNFWLRLAPVFFGKTQFDCYFPTDAVFCFQAFLEECFGVKLLLWGARRILSGALYPLALFLLCFSSKVTAVHAPHFLPQYKVLKFLWWPCAPASSC